MNKTYEGSKRGEQPRVIVHEGERERPLEVDRPDWGTESDGSTRLAAAILAEAGVQADERVVGLFAFAVVACMNQEWTITEEFVREWAEGK